ncbi:unnamed protein product [Paramecium pentaurelia]|uniref:Uncharacterized protein n=1 Tax=Paramecium pentaurelia TaxID=43138 RepID=A0A8S1VCE0_9CILI|nr:unnamed protein product [Paramecium pentaurelia]
MKETQIQCQQNEIQQPLAFTFDELSKVLYVIDKESNIIKYEYNNKQLNIQTTYLQIRIINSEQFVNFVFPIFNGE